MSTTTLMPFATRKSESLKSPQPNGALATVKPHTVTPMAMSYWITLKRALLESLPFSISERQSGMFGLLHALESVATLLLMCDRRDLGTAIGERPPAPDSSSSAVGAGLAPPVAAHLGTMNDFTATRLEDAFSPHPTQFFEPNLYLFDASPGGIGFSDPLFRTHDL